MSILGGNSELDEEKRDRGNGPGHLLIMYTVALLLALPVFIILYPYVPSMTLPIGGGTRVDHLVTFLAVLAAFLVLVKHFQLMVYAVPIVGLCALTITGLSGLRVAVSLVHHLNLGVAVSLQNRQCPPKRCAPTCRGCSEPGIFHRTLG